MKSFFIREHKNLYRKLPALLLVMSMLLPYMDLRVFAAPNDPVVTKVDYIKTHDRFSLKSATLVVKGSNLSKDSIIIEGGNGSIQGVQATVNNPFYVEFQFTQEQATAFSGKINVNGKEIDLGITGLPEFYSADTQRVFAGENIIFKGLYLNNAASVPPNTKIEFGKIYPYIPFSNLTPTMQANDLQITGNGTFLGMHDIIVSKDATSGGVATSAKYNYIDAFGIMEKMDFDGVEMTPNAGSKGDLVTFKSNKIVEGNLYSAFFISQEDDIENVVFGRDLSAEIKNRSAKSSDNVAGNQQKFSVKVPSISNGTKTVVLVKLKGKEVVGYYEIKNPKFALISDDAKPSIIKLSPNSGSANGSSVQMLGDNILIPNLPALSKIPKELDSIQSKVVVQGTNGDTLKITYKTDGIKYSPSGTQKPVTSLTREITGVIGAGIGFEKNENKVIGFEASKDLIKIKTPVINDVNLLDVPQDVVLEIKTTITTADGTYIIHQISTKDKAFTFYSPSVEPVVKSISPAIVPTKEITPGEEYQLNVRKTGSGEKDDLYMSIDGDKFLISKYTDVNTGEANKLNYPIVRILSYSQNFSDDYTEIKIDYNTKKVYVKKKDNTEFDKPLTEFKVLDAKGREILPNEVGTRIVFALPKDVSFQGLGQKSIRVTNPMRETHGEGYSSILPDGLTIKETNNYPIITSVNPNIIAVDSKEDIVLKGRNIDPKAKIFIDGIEVKNVKWVNDATGGSFVATFKAPQARAVTSTTQLLVQNPDAQSATWDFYYVNAQYPDPKIKSINPNFGVKATIAVIEGANFVARNPIISGMSGIEAYKLIGTRVKFDGKDINDYNKDDSGNIELKKFISKNPDLVHISSNKELSPLELSNDAFSVFLKKAETDNRSYILYYDENRNVILSDGANEKYKLTLKEGKIYALKEGDSTEEEVTIKKEGLSFGTLELKMFTPFKASDGVITGNRVRILDANRIALTIPALSTITRVYDVTVENPDTKSDTLRKAFTYYPSARTKPKIETINPAKGSIYGGVNVEITGEDFEKGIRVYFDGIEVPQKDITLVFEKGVTSSKRMVVVVPKYKDIINEVTVPVTVINTDGGSASKIEGFTYVKPASAPKLQKLVLNKGITKGGDVVEIYGEDFRYFEPFSKSGNDDSLNAEYEPGDKFTDLNSNGKWDDLTGKKIDDNNLPEEDELIGKTKFKKNGEDVDYQGYTHYMASPVLPKIYFGTEVAKIVEYGNGYIKVITPANAKGKVDVKLINNDTGMSNSLPYTYEDSKPEIKFITPDQGARIGGEKKVLLGSGFEDSVIYSYQENDDSQYKINPNVKARVRFANHTNKDVPIGQENDGRINANNATVQIDGGLLVQYDGKKKEIKFLLREGGEIYERVFKNYTGEDVYFPAGMLKNKDNKYYQPTGYSENPSGAYNSTNDYELFRAYAEDGRLIVERGYAPYVKYSGPSEIVLNTPSYFDIGLVQVTLFNPDGAQAKSQFKYVNPATKPVIIQIKPRKEVAPNTLDNPTNEKQIFVEGSVEGGANVEIKGRDFRDGAKVFIGTREAQVLDVVKNPDNTQTIIAKSPKADLKEVDAKLPIIITNEDGGTASSIDKNTLEGEKFLTYYVYRKPLSLPEIAEVIPNKTSQFGGNIIKLKGKDFRKGVKVILGAKGGVPLDPIEIDRLGEFLTFRTPSNMPIGPHTVQILNPDFGLKEIPNGLTIISYPIIDSLEADTKLDSGNVSTEGNDKVILKGKNFMPGAKVFVGGDVYGINESAPATDGIVGFGKDDREYSIKNTIEAKKVKVIDSNTIEFYTPEVFSQEKKLITVINTDTGMSASDVRLNFTLPFPNAPLSLKATVVNDKYIKLYDYKSNNHKYFDVYVYMGKKSLSDLRKDKYIDFRQIDNIDYEPYKITRLDGFDALKRADRIVFAMKAVNQYGESGWSNLAYLDFAKFSKIKELGGKDPNGLKALGKEPSLDIKTQLIGNKLDITYPINSFRAAPYLYFRDSRYANVDVVDINLSNRNVLVNANLQKLQMELLDLHFVPEKLNTNEVKTLGLSDQDKVKLNVDIQDNFDKSEKKSKLPRNLKAISPIVKVGASLVSVNKEVKLQEVGKDMKMSFHLDSRQIRKNSNKAYKLYFTDGKGAWKSMPHKLGNSANTMDVEITNYGYYVICE